MKYARGRATLRRFFPFLLFLILVCAFLWKPIFLGKALLPGDFLSQMAPWNSTVKQPAGLPQWNPLQFDAIAQFYPWRVFYARSMSEGKLPLWNPHQFCGTPFLANGQSAVLYPFNLIFLLFNPVTAFTIFAALHLFMAAVFTYILLRSMGSSVLAGIVSGITFAFSAFMVLWLELPTFISVAVYLPLTLLLIHRSIEKRSIFYGMLSGASLGLAFLAGHFQIAFYVGFAAVLAWLWHLVAVNKAEGNIEALLRVVVPFMAFAAIAGLIAAPQILTSQELAAQSHRMRKVTPEGYASFISNSVKPYRLVTAVAPDYFGNPSKNNYYLLGRLNDHIGSASDYIEHGMYVGVLPLILAFFGLGSMGRRKHIGFYAVLGVLALLIAMGTPLNAFFYHLIPGFSAFGGPNRTILLYVFSVAVMAGFGIDYLTLQAAKVTEAEPSAQRKLDRLVSLLAPFYRMYDKYAPIAIPILIAVLFACMWKIAAAQVTDMIGGDAFDQFAPVRSLVLLISVVMLVASAGVIYAFVRKAISRQMFAVAVVALVAADLFAFGINYNPTCDRSKVYPVTPLISKLKHVASGSRVVVINPEWNLFATPKALLPPNWAMVYGLYDAQGYDSLYTKKYKDLSSEVQGMDSSPIENGNMVVFKRYKPDLAQLAQFVVTRDKLNEPGLKFVDSADGVNIYKYAKETGVKLDNPEYCPFSFRLGMFLMMLGIAFIVCIGMFRALRNGRMKAMRVNK